MEVLYIKTSICARMLVPKDRLTIFTNYPSVTKDQALQETVLTLFYRVVYGCFQLIGATIEDTITCHNVVKGSLSKVGLESLVHTK